MIGFGMNAKRLGKCPRQQKIPRNLVGSGGFSRYIGEDADFAQL